MGIWGSSPAAMCSVEERCAEWAAKYMEYCLCSTKDWVSFILGLISLMSWAVAEIPQIITNYKQKSAEGLSLAFLITWVVGFQNNTTWQCYIHLQH
ncbi:lysosomal amino acid transporter 1-like [Coffea eugenioides]|uniref:lysosomal amino acid transporter 1-like n=1 Tax=Coffea eugenioides TaxID=49369 RepID=UPI000F5C957B|nr:lysosomal amino acid transporter 1-like [Coffea arabica]XP_027173442.1 lysosomal amino acid transporter 1-like [Coffea eugenioides]